MAAFAPNKLFRSLASRAEWLLFDRPTKHRPLAIFLLSLVIVYVIVSLIIGQLRPTYCLPTGASPRGGCARCGTRDLTLLLLDQPPDIQAAARRFCVEADRW